MSTMRKMIDSVSLELLAVCILALCLAIPALSAARADGPLLPLISSTIDPPEIPLPFPPPLCQGTMARERAA